jgi:ribulose 1,5-bisphosphate synthetase/thiazole synthase
LAKSELSETVNDSGASLAHHNKMSAGAAMSEPLRAETDVSVIGSNAAGMYAAIEAARGGSRVVLIHRSLIGLGGATVMAQMTSLLL